MGQTETTRIASQRESDTSGGCAGEATFVFHLVLNEHGQVSGVVERVPTGERHQVRSLDALAGTIEDMLAERPAM